MNPFDLAQEVAAQNNLELGYVSPVYAELAAMAAGASPESYTASIPEHVARAQAELNERQREVRRLRMLAQSCRDEAFVVKIPSVQLAQRLKVEIMTILGSIEADQEARDKAFEMASTLGRGLFGAAPETARAFMHLAQVDRREDIVEEALVRIEELGRGTEDGAKLRQAILPTVCDVLGQESALAIAHDLLVPDQARALALLSQHTGDSRYIEEAKKLANGQLQPVSAAGIAPAHAAIYSVNHDPSEREAALRNLAHTPAGVKVDVLTDIACVDLTRESIEAIGVEARGTSYESPGKLYAVFARMMELYAQAGLHTELMEEAQYIANTAIRHDAYERVCKVYIDQGELERSYELIQRLPEPNRARVLAQYLPALVTAGRIDEGIEDLQWMSDQPQHYEMSARMAVAYHKLADDLERTMGQTGVQS